MSLVGGMSFFKLCIDLSTTLQAQLLSAHKAFQMHGKHTIL